MQIIKKIFDLIFPDVNKKVLEAYQPTIDKINSLEPEFEKLSDDALKQKTNEFRARLQKGETMEDLLPEAFAVVREASKRTLEMRHFDVQLIGGIVLHEGKITEMKTGEGKTLAATLPIYLNALSGSKAYLVTVNDYLAKRDADWMGVIYEFLGLSYGSNLSGMSTEEKKDVYSKDIIYGTNNEFGFDYLRDNLARDINECCQESLDYAIVDEVDSILIDEARTPLIISGPVQDSTAKYKKIAAVVRKLTKETHFTVDEKHKNVVLTEEGIEQLEKLLNIEDIYSVQNMDSAHMAVQCLKALFLFKRDVDYVIKNGEVQIVDEFTGRILDGRRYSDGLHQSIEAMENVKIKEESQTLASITFQNYFRMFKKLAGMTGTAVTEEAEFGNIYSLPVVVIPTNMPMIRDDMSDIIYKSKVEKYKAIVNQIKELYKKGQPVLVGTIAIETSELISSLLKRDGVPHNVLNAKYHEKEAEIISGAGQAKSVTIATNMAGRGTDIKLGEGVTNVDGLYVIGSERHESRRIDNQLRGRSGRQGDPGNSRFFVALDDDLMRLFGSDRIARIMSTLGLPDDTPIEHGLISRSIEKAQKKVEQYHFSIRKQILEYDDVINKQRETIYKLRKQILRKEGQDKKLAEYIEITCENVLLQFFPPEETVLDKKLKEDFMQQISTTFSTNLSVNVIDGLKKQKDIIEKLSSHLYTQYEQKKKSHPADIFAEVIKEITLVNVDRKWMDHLHNIDILREGIGLRAWGQRDPLMEYKIEAFDLFSELIANIAHETIETIFKISLVEMHPEEIEMTAPKQLVYNTNKEIASKPKRNDSEKISRNDPCPCGSGKKYKKCCMK
ncbi:preprotein translocase subunit SecA [Candidatus Margulisiibacteriota bacterium]